VEARRLESSCEANSARDVLIGEGHRRIETACSGARAQARSAINVKAFLEESRPTALLPPTQPTPFVSVT
jgi:hypothetical protein